MSEVGPVTGETDRCPRCGARVVPDQEWCSLCLEPLRADADGPMAEPSADGQDLAAEEQVLDGTGDTRAEVDPADPYASATGTPRRAPADDLDPLVAEAMLAELAASSAADRPGARGPLSGAGRGTRLALGCGAAVVLVVVLLLVGSLLGLLL